jgi:hypothetical protein
MIYIFQGVQSICSLPGLLCKGCGNLCSKLNCKPLQDACVNCGSFVTHFFERPLSTFVIFAFLFSAAQLYSSYLAFDEVAEDCNFGGSVDGTTYACIQALVAVILIFFAPYLQRSVWKQIMVSLNENPEDKYVDIESKDPEAEPMVNVKKEVVQGAFKTVFLEDFFVLFIFVVLVANAGLSAMVTTDESCYNPPQPYATNLPKAMLISCGTYTLFYYCCTCCANKVTIERREVGEASGAQPLAQHDSLE